MSAKKQEIIPANDPVPLPTSQGNGGLVQVLDRALRDQNVPMERIEKVWEMIQQIEHRAAKTAWHDAMMATQAEMDMVVKDSRNDQTRSNFASYAALDAAVRPIYTRHGFALTFDTGEGGFGAVPENHVRVLCDALRGAYSRLYHIDIPADGKGAKGGDVMTKTHATMSAVSYGQRGLLKMIFNIATGDKREDDDGNAAARDPISVAQLQALINLADEVGVDKARICRLYKIEGLAQLPANLFETAMKKLRTTRQHQRTAAE